MRKLDQYYKDWDNFILEFNKGNEDRPNERQIAFSVLMERMYLASSASIESRRIQVIRKQLAIRTVLPFLNETESELAYIYLAENQNLELWE